MGKIRQKLNAVRERWFQILIACGALALAFGLGMSFQAEREDAEEEAQIRNALSNFSRQMEIFANDVGRMTRQAEEAQAAGEPIDDPMEHYDPAEHYVISHSLSFLREKAVTFFDITSLRQFNDYGNANFYLDWLKLAFLGGNYRDLQGLSEVVTIFRPLIEARPGGPLEETMALLEENVTSGEYEEALDLLGLELDTSGDLILTGT